MSPGIRPLRWWTDSALARMAVFLEGHLERWNCTWGVRADAPASVVCRRAHERTDGDRDVVFYALSPHDAAGPPQLRLAIGIPAELAIHQAVFGERPAVAPSQFRHTAISDRIVREIWHDWCSAIASIFDEGWEEWLPVLTDALEQTAWPGGLQVAFRQFGLDMVLHIGEECAGRLGRRASMDVTPRQANSRPLTPLMHALADVPLRLSAELSEAELELGSLQQLTVGDVICLPHALDRPLLLRADGAMASCGAYLGQVAGQRALALTAAKDESATTSETPKRNLN